MRILRVLPPLVIGKRIDTAGIPSRHHAVRFAARLVLILVVCSWMFLYLDSVHQRRKAESLVAELKSFNFATAGFRDVRDLAIRNGGAALQRNTLPKLPDFGTPVPDARGNAGFRRPGPFCNMQDCTFEIWITTRLVRLPLRDRTAELFYSALPYLGVRSWLLYARFEVRNDRLESSSTTVEEIRFDRLGSYEGLVPFGYQVMTTTDATYFDPNQDYKVFLDHPVKLPENVLSAHVLRTSALTKRAFDMNLHCLNGLFRGCRFNEIAPSAWADYSATAGTGR